jgi:hypothetical protein
MKANTVQMSSKPPGPPFPPDSAILGGVPVKSIDDPITSMFLVLFFLCAVGHMSIFIRNKKNGRMFPLSALCFGFCMARITTCTMRLVWSSYSTNVRIAIAAQIFVQVGVIILFLVNLIFTQRIIRASYPHWAWKKWFSVLFIVYFASVIITLIALITVSIQSFYTLNTNTHRIDRVIRLYGALYFAVVAFLPLPILLLKLVIPTRSPVEKFGHGRFRTKIIIVAFASTLLTLGAAFRAGTNYFPRRKESPAWYHSKACFYLFNFTLELVVIVTFLAVRIDKRFIVPDGSRGPGHYVNGSPGTSTADRLPQHSSVTGMNLTSEQSVFYDTQSTMHHRGSETSLIRERQGSGRYSVASKPEIYQMVHVDSGNHITPTPSPQIYEQPPTVMVSSVQSRNQNFKDVPQSKVEPTPVPTSGPLNSPATHLFPPTRPGNRMSRISTTTSTGGETIYDDAKSQFSEPRNEDEHTKK